MSREFVLSKLEELGFETEEVGELGYCFKYEDLNVLYMPDGDENFLRFAVPKICDVTEENKAFVLEVVNDTNLTIKYSKTCIMGEDVWVFCEYRLFSEENLVDIIEHNLMLLQATYYLFYRKIERDDSLLIDGEDDNDDEYKENTI